MKRIWLSLAIALILSMATMASAATYNFYDNLYNRDGSVSRIDPWGLTPLPFDFGALSLSTSFTTQGSHSITLMMDAEIDQAINTFFNETGTTHGSVAAGQSWQIGDPMVLGGIYDLTAAGALTNSDLNGGRPNDVALALGWNFTLGALQTATVSFYLSDALPISGFYLEQYDPDSQASLYFSSTLKIEDTNPNTVPEPSTFLLLGSAIAGLALYRRRAGKSA
jgi:hypothetical protein